MDQKKIQELANAKRAALRDDYKDKPGELLAVIQSVRKMCDEIGDRHITKDAPVYNALIRLSYIRAMQQAKGNKAVTAVLERAMPSFK